MNRTRRSILNYVFTLTFVLVTAITGFVTTPWLLRWLGNEKFGAARALLSWFGVIGLLELGLTTSLIAELAQALGKKDSVRLRGVIRAGSLAFAAIGAVMLACAVAFASIAPYLIKVESKDRGDLFCAVLIAACGFLVYPVLSLRALAEARGQTYILQTALLIQSLLLTGMSLVFAYLGMGISGQSFASVAAGFILVAVLVSIYRSDFLGAWFVQTAETRAATTRLWHVNRTAALWGLCAKFQQDGTGLLVAAVFGSASNSDVYASQRLLLAVGAAVLAVGGSTWAVLSEAHHQRVGGAVAPFLTVSSLTSTMAAAVLLPLVAVNRAFVGIWVGPDYYLGELFTSLTAAGLLLYALFNLWAMTLIGVGGLVRLAPTLTVATLLGVAIGAPVTWWLGPLGAVVVVDAVMVAMLLGPVPLLLRELLGIPLRRLLARILLPWAVAAVPAAALLAAIQWQQPKNLLEVGGMCAAYGVVYAVLAWRFVLTAAERSMVLARVGMRAAVDVPGSKE